MYFRLVLTATATAALIIGSATVGDAAVLSPTPRSSSHADDGTVYTSVQVGSRLFVGGSFTSVDGTPRVRLAALDAATGRLDTSFRADVDGDVRSLASDGRTLFIGGKFTQVDGVARKNLAAVNAIHGRCREQLQPCPAGMVRGLAYSGGKVFFGGGFTKVGGTAVNYLAAADAATGALDSGFPGRRRRGQCRQGLRRKRLGRRGLRPRRLGHPQQGSRRLHRRFGAELPGDAGRPGGRPRRRHRPACTWPSPAACRRATPCTRPPPPARRSGRWPPTATSRPSRSRDSTVYAGGHFGSLCGSTTSGCGNTTSAKKAFVADASGTTPNARPWAKFNSALGVWDLSTAGNNLYALGVFTKVNGKITPRIARFSG